MNFCRCLRLTMATSKFAPRALFSFAMAMAMVMAMAIWRKQYSCNNTHTHREPGRNAFNCLLAARFHFPKVLLFLWGFSLFSPVFAEYVCGWNEGSFNTNFHTRLPFWWPIATSPFCYVTVNVSSVIFSAFSTSRRMEHLQLHRYCSQ